VASVLIEVLLSELGMTLGTGRILATRNALGPGPGSIGLPDSYASKREGVDTSPLAPG